MMLNEVLLREGYGVYAEMAHKPPLSPYGKFALFGEVGSPRTGRPRAWAAVTRMHARPPWRLRFPTGATEARWCPQAGPDVPGADGDREPCLGQRRRFPLPSRPPYGPHPGPALPQRPGLTRGVCTLVTEDALLLALLALL